MCRLTSEGPHDGSPATGTEDALFRRSALYGIFQGLVELT